MTEATPLPYFLENGVQQGTFCEDFSACEFTRDGTGNRLDNAVDYTFSVLGGNSGGLTSPVQITARPGARLMPEITSLVPLDSALQVNWQGMAQTVPVVRYEVTAFGGGQVASCTPVPQTDTSCTITGLNNGQGYIVSVRAYHTSTNGESTFSLTQVGTPQATPTPDPALRRWVEEFAVGTALAAADAVTHASATPDGENAWRLFSDVSYLRWRGSAPGNSGYTGRTNLGLAGVSYTRGASSYAVAVSHAQGRGTAGQTPDRLRARQTSVHGVVHRQISAATRMTFQLGAGQTRLEAVAGLLPQSDYQLHQASIAAQTQLDHLDYDNLQLGATVQYVAVKAKDRSVLDLDSRNWRAQTQLALGKTWQLADQQTLAGSAGLALRYDAGDLRDGLGLALDTTVEYAAVPHGFAAQLRAGWLATHGDSATRLWQLGGQLSYDARAHGGSWQFMLKSGLANQLARDDFASDKFDKRPRTEIELAGYSTALQLEPFGGASVYPTGGYGLYGGLRTKLHGTPAEISLTTRANHTTQATTTKSVWLQLEQRF